MESGAPHFRHNDIIWAKVTGHPWWPGVINNEEPTKNLQLYRVDFFGFPPSQQFWSNFSALLPYSKIIKYEDYEKLPSSETGGRPSPALKKAMLEASTLFNTLQQSKNSPINRAMTTSCPFEIENTVTSACKSQYRQFQDEKLLNKDQQYQSGSELALQKCNPKQKRIKKQREAITQLPKPRRFVRRPEQSLFHLQLQNLLKVYKLQNVPSKTATNGKQKSKPKSRTKQNNQQISVKVCKFLFKICKKYFERNRSIEIVLKYENAVGNLEQLRQAINQIKNEFQNGRSQAKGNVESQATAANKGGMEILSQINDIY